MASGRRSGNREMSPLRAGLIVLVLIAIISFFGFTKYNPFANPYELNATFESANNLKPNSPVRIAGVNVGIVKKVTPVESGSGAAEVAMELKDSALPIHKDAELKIRPRIFLEGNFFVDVRPGSPSAPKLESGAMIPTNQTATPVQFGQVLTALQSDTREDLRTLLIEYSIKGLGNGGAEGFNRSVPYWEPAYKNSALVNEAMLGTQVGDLTRVLRGQAGTLGALVDDEDALKDFITNFNTTAAAFAREDDALQAAIPQLRRVLEVGPPALRSLGGSFPSLRAFARDAIPGVRSSGPTIDASLPFVRQLRLLFSERELRGLVRDLRPAIPALARLNRGFVPFLEQQRALARCANRTLIPFAREPIPNPDEPENSNQPFYKQAPRTLVGLAGESRIHDANSPLFRVQFSGGAVSAFQFGEATREPLVSQQPFQIEGTRPAKPTFRPPFRPGTPCETQDPPDLNAPRGGAPPQAIFNILGQLQSPLDLLQGTLPGNLANQLTGAITGGAPPLPITDRTGGLPVGGTPLGPVRAASKLPKAQRKRYADYLEELERRKVAITDFQSRERRGLPAIDPVAIPEKLEGPKLKRMGLVRDEAGRLRKRGARR